MNDTERIAQSLRIHAGPDELAAELLAIAHAHGMTSKDVLDWVHFHHQTEWTLDQFEQWAKKLEDLVIQIENTKRGKL